MADLHGAERYHLVADHVRLLGAHLVRGEEGGIYLNVQEGELGC